MSEKPNKYTSPAGRYILYAIGEIALVMIGILLALQVNNWNEERKNRNEEQYYLGKLVQNLAQDTTYIQHRINSVTLSLDDLELLKTQIQDPDLPEFESSIITSSLLTVHRFTPQTSTMDNLTSTGKLDLLQNQSLVDSLFIYYNDLNNYPEQTNTSNDTYTRETIGPRLMDMQGGFMNLNKSALTDSDKNFLTNAIDIRRIINSNLREYYTESLQRARSIIHQLHSERN